MTGVMRAFGYTGCNLGHVAVGCENRMIDLGKFEIETATLELRYDPALALWDRAGEIWADVVTEFPDLRFQNALPQQQIFETRQVRAMVELEAIRVICRGEAAEARMVALSQSLLKACSERLRISVFTRVGLRAIRVLRFSELEKAFSEFSSVIPESFLRSSVPESKPIAFTFTVRHEGTASGLIATLRVEQRETKVNAPWEVRDRVPDSFPNENLVVLDNDYFTIGATRREALSIEDWVRQAERTISRHWKGVFG